MNAAIRTRSCFKTHSSVLSGHGFSRAVSGLGLAASAAEVCLRTACNEAPEGLTSGAEAPATQAVSARLKSCPDEATGGFETACKRIQEPHRQGGFTLLEALVATAVLGTAVAALLGLFSGALRNVSRIEPAERALLLGQNKLEELLVTEATPPGEAAELPLNRKVAGRWDERFRWEAEAIRLRPAPEAVPGAMILARITLDVFWKSGTGSEERKLSFETYQLRRESAGAGR